MSLGRTDRRARSGHKAHDKPAIPARPAFNRIRRGASKISETLKTLALEISEPQKFLRLGTVGRRRPPISNQPGTQRQELAQIVNVDGEERKLDAKGRRGGNARKPFVETGKLGSVERRLGFFVAERAKDPVGELGTETEAAERARCVVA